MFLKQILKVQPKYYSSFISKFQYTEIIGKIQFTENSLNKIQEKLSKSQNQFLRLTVDAGEGCSGFSYKFGFDSQIKEDDLVQKNSSGKIIFATDDISLKLIEGCTIDYEQEMIRSAFIVSINPNAMQSCSCKVSFSPKEGII